MSIPNLPVDFKDDILASSNTKRKYRQTTNGDSTVSFEDVTNYSQEGSEFGAKEVNQTNTAINNIYDERVLDVDALELITEPGFFVDAQVVKELNGNNKVYKYAITVKPYPASNPGNTLTINVYKQNRMCMGYVSWLGSATNDTSIIGEFTVPEAFCPVYDVFFSSPVVTSGTILSHGSTRFNLGTDGRLTFTTDEQGFVERRAAFAFLSNDIVPGDSYLQ